MKIIQGDCLEILPTLEAESVQLCCTSPPYWGLRDYGVESQLGLEKTPEEYVSKMVQVFREVWRVLRKDGTVWLNLGDSYCGSGINDGSKNPGLSKAAARSGPDERPSRNHLARNGLTGGTKTVDVSLGGNSVVGLKPKDLVGIPWRVAFALQQPFYAGKIKKESDRIWLAAMIDGEGCMFIHKRKAGQPNGQGYFRKNDVYGAGLEVANTHESIIKRCMEITGEQGSICRVERETKNRFRNIPLYRWNMRSNQCREIIAEIYPYLVGKQHEARILLGCPPSGPDAEKAHASLIALHNGKDACIDFPPPKSFYEPGWYLRSDIIWAKKNPMPESVTDRCTKAHEYIFLLTKSAKYFYDAEAVKEDGVIAAGTKGAKGSKERFEMDGVNSRPPEYKVYSGTRNLRSVWTIATESFPDAHFATFPRKLVEPCILAGTSEKGCCPECGSPWVREIKRTPATSKPCPKEQASHEARGGTGNHTGTVGKSGSGRIDGFTETLGWSPTCSCNMAYPDYEAARDDPAYVPYNPVPCTILDPFAGSGTTGLVAYEHGREFIGIELSPDYCRMAEKRIAKATAQGKLF